jgi:hypothetical protein
VTKKRPSEFQIYRFNSSNFNEILSNADIDVGEVASHSHAVYMFNYLNKIGAKTMIVENDYTDIDYLDDFATYYVRCHYNYPKTCKRIHFFSIPLISYETFLEVVTNDEPVNQVVTDLCDSYLGFTVARPLPRAIIGRTIVKTCSVDNDSETRQFPCTKDYSVNLFGIELFIKNSLAFQQQDKVVSACATVALWCCFHKLSNLFNTALPRPSAITRAATEPLNNKRGFPSKGLNVEQICRAITHFGLEPEVISIERKSQSSTPVISLIYSYLRMGLPVILGCEVATRKDGKLRVVGKHAVPIVGYNLNESRQFNRECDLSEDYRGARMIGLRIDRFYTHDDQEGPFSRMGIIDYESIKSTEEESTERHPIAFKVTRENDLGSEERKIMYPVTIIVPTYNKVRISFLDLQRLIKRTGYAMYEAMMVNAKQAVADGLDGESLADIERYVLESMEWDIYLSMTNDFKKEVKRKIEKISKDGLGNPPYLKEKIRQVMTTQGPRFIWCLSLRIHQLDGSIVPIMDILCDATGISHAFPAYDLIWYNEPVRDNLRSLLRSTDGARKLLEITKPKLKDFLHKSVG